MTFQFDMTQSSRSGHRCAVFKPATTARESEPGSGNNIQYFWKYANYA